MDFAESQALSGVQTWGLAKIGKCLSLPLQWWPQPRP